MKHSPARLSELPWQDPDEIAQLPSLGNEIKTVLAKFPNPNSFLEALNAPQVIQCGKLHEKESGKEPEDCDMRTSNLVCEHPERGPEGYENIRTYLQAALLFAEMFQLFSPEVLKGFRNYLRENFSYLLRIDRQAYANHSDGPSFNLLGGIQPDRILGRPPQECPDLHSIDFIKAAEAAIGLRVASVRKRVSDELHSII